MDLDISPYAEVDAMFPAEKRRLAEDILQGQKDYYIQVFSGVEHGFGSRSDLTNERQRKPSACRSRRLTLMTL